MDSNGDVGHEEEMDFHLETADDISSDDDNTSSNRNPSSKEDSNASYDKEMFRRMSHAAQRYTTLDEYWDKFRKEMAADLIFAEANEVKKVKEAVEALMNRQDDDAE